MFAEDFYWEEGQPTSRKWSYEKVSKNEAIKEHALIRTKINVFKIPNKPPEKCLGNKTRNLQVVHAIIQASISF